MNNVLLPDSSPLVTFRLLFMVGAAADPPGQQGVATLTAAMLSQGGTRERSYEQIVQAMYPLAAQFNAQADKEMTVFCGTTHIDNLEAYYGLIREMLLDPGWRESDFARLKEDALNYLRVILRRTNDEELGKEVLYNLIYEGHPYGHNNTGTIESLGRLTLEDVKRFYRANYSRANFSLGLAGGYPVGFEERVKADFETLPAGSSARQSMPPPAEIRSSEMLIIEKETPGTAITFGFPIEVARGHRDWPALLLAQSYFGQHRSSDSYLYGRMRQIRGLNYGDYAYIEYFPRGMFQFQPDPNLARSRQIFHVWIRPVEPQNGLFALRLALYELSKLVDQGISKAEFEATRTFLTKYVSHLTRTQDARLGYAIDSEWYGIPEFTSYVRGSLAALEHQDVNAAIKRHLRASNLKAVIVTGDAAGFRAGVLAGEPSPISYPSPVPVDILEEDKTVERFPPGFEPDSVRIVPVEAIFER